MFEDGELDALISAHMPSPFVRRSPKVKRLIPNFREVEEGLLPADKNLSDHARDCRCARKFTKSIPGWLRACSRRFRGIKTNLRGSRMYEYLGP